MDCIFCRIAKKEVPAEFIYEDENIFVVKDIKPLAPIHFLVIPKKHITSVDHLESSDKGLLADLFFVAQKIAKEKGFSCTLDEKKGYKLFFNVGQAGGQVISHLHLHLLAGWQ